MVMGSGSSTTTVVAVRVTVVVKVMGSSRCGIATKGFLLNLSSLQYHSGRLRMAQNEQMKKMNKRSKLPASCTHGWWKILWTDVALW